MLGDINSQNAVMQERARMRDEVTQLPAVFVEDRGELCVSRAAVLRIIRGEV